MEETKINIQLKTHTIEENEEGEPDSDYEDDLTPPFFLENVTEEDIEETTAHVYSLFDTIFQQNPLAISSPKFYSQMCRDIADILFEEWEDVICLEEGDEEDYDEIMEFLENLLESYHMFSEIPPRSIKHDDPVEYYDTPLSKEEIEKRIQKIRDMPQPKQRTPEWYTFRNGLLSASNLWKVFSSEAQVNSLIYEKCRAVNVGFEGGSGGGAATNWGIKYEPVSVMLYEIMFSVNVEDFGCIQHPQYAFLGASPDGIITSPSTNRRYGRMLEIKNIVNRDITGIPKEEYWIQTQIQMETCNLDECDFLETRFLEYSDANAFYEDGERDYKGVILHFIRTTSHHLPNSSTEAVYKYMPLDVVFDLETVEEWVRLTKIECRSEGLVLLNTIYWYLDEMSCVLIKRNRTWFSAAIPKIRAVWDTIVRERETGYEHRASKIAVARMKAAAAAAAESPAFTPDDVRIVVSTADADTTSRSIRNMPFGNSICLVKLED
jgi:hypothetical protein